MSAASSFVVTGASGFVGRALMARMGPGARALSMASPDWRDAAAGIALRDAVVVHLAARVHRPTASVADFMRDNAEKTRELARLAAQAGARRFVYLSTIKVNGEETRGHAFTPDDTPAPMDAYARSKLAGEVALLEIAGESSMSAAIVRSPLVFGRGAVGNVRALLRLADSPWPLPLASIANRRSFVHVDDLAQCLVACTRSGSAHTRTYLAAHREIFSTAVLVTMLRARLGRRARLFGLPRIVLEAVASLGGGADRMRRLTRSLEVDPSRAETELGWVARKGLAAALDELVAGYREGRP